MKLKKLHLLVQLSERGLVNIPPLAGHPSLLQQDKKMSYCITFGKWSRANISMIRCTRWTGRASSLQASSLLANADTACGVCRMQDPSVAVRPRSTL